MATLEDFKTYISPEVPGVDVITLENYIRLAINTFCEETWFFQKAFTVDVEDGDIDTDLNGSIIINASAYASGMRPIHIADLWVDGEPMELSYVDLVNDAPDIDMLSVDTQRIFSFSGESSIRIAPFTGACRVFLRVVFKYLLTCSTYDDRLLHDYVLGIAANVKSELLAQPGMPWTNEVRSEYFRRKFREEVNTAKLRLGKNFSKQGRAVYPREFGF